MQREQKSQSINTGFARARSITRLHAKIFYIASYLLPRAKRYAAYTVYAACRISDDAVDEEGTSRADKLSRIKENIASTYSDAVMKEPLFLALRKTVKDYQIPKEHFDLLIEGMQMDLSKNRYKDFGELYDYSYKAAGVVGLIMLKLFDPHSEKTKDYAVALGIAMQLTNIIRDIEEDYLRGRIYLPEEEMKKFTISEADIAQGRMNEGLKGLLKFQTQRARQYYRQCETGIKMLSDTRCRMVTRAMKEMYEALLDEIERKDYDVFSKCLYVNRLNKLRIVSKILLCTKCR